MPAHLAVRPLSLATVLAMLLTLLVGVGPARAAGTIVGTVTGDGTPLGAVTVELQPAGGGALIDSTTTSASGTFSLAAEAGTYDVVVTPPAGSGYQPATVEDRVVNDEETTTVDLELVLIGGGSDVVITGSVVASTGPAAGADVTLDTAIGTTTTTTDAAGVFSATPDRGSGDLVVQVSAPCGDASLPEVLRIDTDFDANRFTDYPVRPVLGPVTVRVQDPAGDPIAGATVRSFSRATPPAPVAPLGGRVLANNACGLTTDALGAATLVTAADVLTSVTASADGYSIASVDVTVPEAGGDVVVTLAPLVELTGVVTGVDGRVRPGVDVSVSASDQPGQVVTTDATGRFTAQTAAGPVSLRLVGERVITQDPDGPRAGFVARVSVDVPVDGLDLGTWQLPLAEVDVEVLLEGTSEPFPSTLSISRESGVVEVFGRNGRVDAVPGVVSTSDQPGPFAIPAYLLPGAVHRVSLLTSNLPAGYTEPDDWELVGPPGSTSTSATLELPLFVDPDTVVTGRVVQDGEPVEGVRIFDDRSNMAPTDTEGRFQLVTESGERDLFVNLPSAGVGAPGFTFIRLRDLAVPSEGLDLGDLALPFVPWDVIVRVPEGDQPGDQPVEVDLRTNFTDLFVDAGWGPMFFRGGYYVGGGQNENILTVADGQPIRLWMLPSRDEVVLDVTPVGDTPYEAQRVRRTISGPSTLQIQLQREGDPEPPPEEDLPPTIEGLTSRSVGESAPNVRLSVAASDPEGEGVIVTWDVPGVAPAPTGSSVDLGAFDGPQSFDVVATACDPAGNCASLTVAVEIRDEPPALDANLPGSADVDQPVTLLVDASDPRDEVVVEVAWGDGTAGETVREGVATHTWTAPGTYDVVVSAVTDDATTTTTLQIVVAGGDEPSDDPDEEPPTDEDPEEPPTDTEPPAPAPGPAPAPVDPVLSLVAGPACVAGVNGVEVLLQVEQGSFPTGGVTLTLTSEVGVAELDLGGPLLDVFEVGGSIGSAVVVDTDVTDPVSVTLGDCTDVLGTDVEQDPDDQDPGDDADPEPDPEPEPQPEPSDPASDDSLGEQVVAPAPDDEDEALAATGFAAGPLGSLALGLLALGLLLLSLAPRRRTD